VVSCGTDFRINILGGMSYCRGIDVVLDCMENAAAKCGEQVRTMWRNYLDTMFSYLAKSQGCTIGASKDDSNGAIRDSDYDNSSGGCRNDARTSLLMLLTSALFSILLLNRC